MTLVLMQEKKEECILNEYEVSVILEVINDCLIEGKQGKAAAPS